MALTLITLADLKTYLGITGVAEDAKLTLIGEAAEAFVESYCGRSFLSATYTQEQYDGEGTNELKLRQWPVTAFTLLERNQYYVENDDDWDTVDAENYWIDYDNADRGVIKANFKFDEYPHNFRVTYTAGYLIGNMPSDLQLAIYEITGTYRNNSVSQGISRERVGDYDVTFSKIVLQNDMIRDILTNYKDYSKSVI